MELIMNGVDIYLSIAFQLTCLLCYSPLDMQYDGRVKCPRLGTFIIWVPAVGLRTHHVD